MIESYYTLYEKVGQMIIAGFRGFSIDKYDNLAINILKGKISGVVLFDYDVSLKNHERNIKSPEELKALCTQLQSFSKIPLIISVDQEGGYVSRFKEKYGFPPSVSQMYLGQINNPDVTRKYASLTAGNLSEYGININLAPDVDLNVNPENPVIGKIERSFSSDHDIVIKNAEIMIEEFHKKDVIATIKHFPGHGSSKADSHLGFVDVSDSWTEIELEPFKRLIDNGYNDLIMTAHIFNSKLDDKYPATLSKIIINGILRQKLNFEGLIISDDMQMKAITDHFGFEQSIQLAINAGVDLLCFGNNVVFDADIIEKVHSAILKLLEEKLISEQRIEESFARIMKFKAKMKKPE